MSDFRQQIENDIALIQREYGHIDHRLQDDAYAFHYWVLSRIYSLDEDIIPSNITESNDKGIDCFVHYEDTKELFIIQNKYYDENTDIDRQEAADFLKTPLSVLLRGQYTRSPQLQRIFDRAHQDSDYKIWLHFFVTNMSHSTVIEGLFDGFSYDNTRIYSYVGAKLFNIDSIQRMYFDDRFTNKTTFTAIMPTRFAATSLDVRPVEYDLPWMIDLRYVMINVAELYQIYKEASQKNYELFEENIREYLGTHGINNGIIKTLKSIEDRENFFYYNNGITIICESCSTLNSNTMPEKYRKFHYQYGFKLKNPQIVNGCQTINSIAEVLSHYDDERMHKEFEKSFVLVKIFVFDEVTKRQKAGLDKNIVRYTNSQNGITDKAFASKKSYFLNIQKEFLNRGYLLLVKPSDKNILSSQYEDKVHFAELRKKSEYLNEVFDLSPQKISDYMIPLEKLLKVLLSFYKDGFTAFTKGSTVLKPNSPMYKEFSLNIETWFTIDNMLKLYLMYNKCENEKRSGDKRTPISYYLLSFIGNACKVKEFGPLNAKLNYLFGSREVFIPNFNFYKQLTSMYAEDYNTTYKTDYNVMIKQEMNIPMLEKCFNMALGFYPERKVVSDFVQFDLQR